MAEELIDDCLNDPMKWLAEKFELSRGGSGHHVRPMEGLRGFAVFLVFLVHYVTLVRPWIVEHPALLSLASMLHTIGNTGVDLFFVLSGYLIYGTLISRPQKFRRFMSRRIQRIYPTFSVVFMTYVALSFVFRAESKIPSSSLGAATYLIENFLLLPGLFPIEPMITVAWSLSYEMAYYLAIPLLIEMFSMRRRSAMWRVGFFSIAALLTTAYCAIAGGPVRLIMFMSGILLYEAIESRRVPAPSGMFAFLALFFGLLATLLPMHGSSAIALKVGILFCAFFVLCLACFSMPLTWLPTAFSWTPVRWLGNMSYSYYLLHGLALKAAFLGLATVLPIANYGSWVFWMLLPIMFVLTAIPSAILFLAVERPFSLTPATKPSR